MDFVEYHLIRVRDAPEAHDERCECQGGADHEGRDEVGVSEAGAGVRGGGGVWVRVGFLALQGQSVFEL
jgi:hypothetical protein